MHTLDLYSLAGKTALVTGGGHGIGRHLSLGLAEAGADVVLVGRKEEPLLEVAQLIASMGRKALVETADLANTGEIDRLVGALYSQGCDVDILVNNAGMVWAAPALDYPLEGWDRVFDLNVRGLFYLSQQLGRGMRDRGAGNIINVASVSAWRCAPDDKEPVVAYNASKGAVVSLTRDLGVKLAPDNIRVNCIAPGPFLTSMMNHVRHDPEALAVFESTIPQRRSGTEDDIKGVVVFLASTASAYITGQTITVDGGWTCT